MRDVAPAWQVWGRENMSHKCEKPSSKCATLFSSSSVIIRSYLFEGEVIIRCYLFEVEVMEGFAEKVQRFYVKYFVQR